MCTLSQLEYLRFPASGSCDAALLVVEVTEFVVKCHIEFLARSLQVPGNISSPGLLNRGGCLHCLAWLQVFYMYEISPWCGLASAPRRKCNPYPEKQKLHLVQSGISIEVREKRLTQEMFLFGLMGMWEGLSALRHALATRSQVTSSLILSCTDVSQHPPQTFVPPWDMRIIRISPTEHGSHFPNAEIYFNAKFVYNSIVKMANIYQPASFIVWIWMKELKCFFHRQQQVCVFTLRLLWCVAQVLDVFFGCSATFSNTSLPYSICRKHVCEHCEAL